LAGVAGPAPAAPTAGRFVGFLRGRDVQYQLTGLLGQGSTGGPEQEGGPVLVPAGVVQDAGEQQPVQLSVGLRVQVAGVGPSRWRRNASGSRPPPRGAGERGGSGSSGRKSGSRTGPWARSSARFSTLCNSRMLPGQG